jgi:5-(carboxyamino)imidazole ribonucleotide synthase
MTKFYPNSTIGILGGGQLGKMVLHVANRLNLNVAVLDPDASCPASSICTRFVQGSFLDFETVLEFGRSVDIITIEIENVNTDALAVLESEGKMVFPSVKTIQTLKDKSTQKAFYKANSIPSPFYTSVSGKCEFEMLLSAQEISIPCVWKASQGGYDGRGVFFFK